MLNLALASLLLCVGTSSDDRPTGSVSIRNIELAIVLEAVVSGPYVGFLVDELDQGGADLNGDGDSDDFVFHTLDTRSGVVVNTELSAAGGIDPLAWNGIYVLTVIESGGMQDLNGDRDLVDGVLFLYDARTGVTTNSRIAASNAFVRGSRVFAHVRESKQGDTDLNGDGDAVDDVVFWASLESGEPQITGLASTYAPVPFGDWMAVTVRETSQGNTDLDGDGMVDDDVMHIVDLSNGAVQNLSVAAVSALCIGGGRLVFDANEGRNGVDYNGNGEIEDLVSIMQVFDAHSGTVVNSGREGMYWARSPEFDGLFFFADIADGFGPPPVHAYDTVSGDVWPLGISASAVMLAWQSFVATPTKQTSLAEVADALTGRVDRLTESYGFASFEGGILTARVSSLEQMRSFDPFLRREQSLGHAYVLGTGLRFPRSAGRAAWTASELEAGTDYNGDGDLSDAAALVFDPAENVVHFISSYFSIPQPPGFAGDIIAGTGSEYLEGVGDLNGDGDTDDNVLHIVRLDFPDHSDTRYGRGVRGWRQREPHLEVLGAVASGRVLVTQLRTVRPDSVGAMVIGTAADSVPLFGGTLLVAQPFLGTSPLTTIALGFDGVGRTEWGVLAPELVGEAFYFQGAVIDSQATGGVAMSKGLRVVVGG